MIDNLLHLTGAVVIIVAGLGALAAFTVVLLRALPNRAASAADDRTAELARLQAETTVRIEAMRDLLCGRQSELAKSVNERLDSVTHHLNQSMHTTREHTVHGLQKLNERLAIIDSAQKNLTELATHVSTLGAVLGNKQARGAFGQGRMEAIVRDALPKGAYAFQPTLANGKRPDCAVYLPDGRPLVIDAKFPLEAITALRDAKGEDARKQAVARLRQDISRHVADIAEKYLVPGETQDIALMFVPSESVFADLHDSFDDLIQKAYRARVVLVSPALLMLAIQVVQQIQKDARMREAADVIRNEVGLMAKDLRLLHDRVAKLQQHFGQANEDVRQILISAEKIDKRASRIEELEFGGEAPAPDAAPMPAHIERKIEAAE